jgi:hypothetical protein
MNGFLQDSEGNKSSSRALMVFGTGFVLLIWGITSLRLNAIQPVPWEVLGLVTALITGKLGTGYISEQGKQ